MFILEVCTVTLWWLIKTTGVVLSLPFGLGPLLLWLLWLWATGSNERGKRCV